MDAGGWFYEVEGARRGPVSLAELKQLVADKTVTAATPVWAEGLAAPVKAGGLAVLFPPQPDGATSWLLPVGRSGFAIAAGYLGLLSFVPFVGVLALLFAGLAIRDLLTHKEKRGWGRVVTALVIGLPTTVFYAFIFLAH